MFKKKKNSRVHGSLGPKPYVFIFWAIAMTTVSGALYLYSLTIRPSEGRITTGSASDSLTEEEPITYEAYSGEHAAFEYPDYYNLAVSEEPGGVALEERRLSVLLPTGDSRRIGLTIKRPPVGQNYTDDSAYRFRANSENNYQEQEFEIGGQNYDAFIKDDNSELTLFIVGGDKYAIVSGGTVRDLPGLRSDLEHIVSTWEWKQ